MAIRDPCGDATFLGRLREQPEFPYDTLKDQQNRTKTFSDPSWRDTDIARTDYAEAGFYFTGEGDMIKCPSCYLEVKDMKNPKKEMGKKLPFLHAWLSGRGCPLIAEYFRSRNPDINTDAPSRREPGMDPVSDDWPRLGFETSPMHPIFTTSEGTRQQTYSLEDLNVRLRTYVNFPQTDRPTVQSLAEAGFFHNPNRSAPDKVTCFWCDGSLEGWMPNEVPWAEHAKYYPGCNYLRKTKGTNYILFTRNSRTEAERSNSQGLRYTGSGIILAIGFSALHDVYERIRSFGGHHHRREFSMMGFYAATDNFMECYACGLNVAQSSSPDEAKEIHRTESRDCDFSKVDPLQPADGAEGVLYVEPTYHYLLSCECVVHVCEERVFTYCPYPACGQQVQWQISLDYDMGNQ